MALFVLNDLISFIDHYRATQDYIIVMPKKGTYDTSGNNTVHNTEC